jgi:hypothetical protein
MKGQDNYVPIHLKEEENEDHERAAVMEFPRVNTIAPSKRPFIGGILSNVIVLLDHQNNNNNGFQVPRIIIRPDAPISIFLASTIMTQPLSIPTAWEQREHAYTLRLEQQLRH